MSDFNKEKKEDVLEVKGVHATKGINTSLDYDFNNDPNKNINDISDSDKIMFYKTKHNHEEENRLTKSKLETNNQVDSEGNLEFDTSGIEKQNFIRIETEKKSQNITNDDNKSVVEKICEADDELRNSRRMNKNLIDCDNTPTKLVDKKEDSDDNLNGSDEKEKKINNLPNYQASSPDEVALVKTAAEFGCQLFYRDDKKVIIRNLIKCQKKFSVFLWGFYLVFSQLI